MAGSAELPKRTRYPHKHIHALPDSYRYVLTVGTSDGIVYLCMRVMIQPRKPFAVQPHDDTRAYLAALELLHSAFPVGQRSWFRDDTIAELRCMGGKGKCGHLVARWFRHQWEWALQVYDVPIEPLPQGCTSLLNGSDG